MPITKATENPDGSIDVEGLCTDDGLDLDEQIIDRDFATKGLSAWFTDWANVRQMHAPNLPPAGTAVKMERRPEGIWVQTHVYEPGAVLQVRNGGYKAYSVGISRPRIIRDGVAKNGRVVDGVFSEISLVDFPANPRSRFQLAKRAKPEASAPIEIVEKTVSPNLTKAATVDDDAPVTVKPSDMAAMLRKLHKPGKGGSTTTTTTIAPTTKAATTDDDGCDLCEGRGKIRRGKVGCPDCKGSGKASDVVAKASDAVLVKGSKDCGNCGKSHDADSDHRFCSDCGSKLPGAGKAAAAEVEKKLPPHREPDGDEAGPDVDDDGDGHTAADDDEDGEDDRVEKGAGATYHLRRLHDATCAAYREADVLGEHPALAKGIPSVVDADVFAATLSKALAAPVSDHVLGLGDMADAYALAAQLGATDPMLLETAMGEVRKAFAEYYPDAHPTPTQMTPGAFRRTYLGTGHATQSAKAGQKPRMPLATHVPDPADFRRPLMTAGHEAASPGNGKAAAATLTKGRTYYSGAAKQQAAQQLTAMHDYIVEQHPGVCPMHGPTPDGEPALAGANGSMLTRATAAATTIDVRATATPTSVSAETAASVVTKGTDVTALIKAALDEVLAPISEELSTLGKRLGDLESAPDPADVSYRGHATLAALRGAADDDPAGREDVLKATERVVGLVKRAQQRDSTVAQPALQELLELVGPDDAAKLLTK